MITLPFLLMQGSQQRAATIVQAQAQAVIESAAASGSVGVGHQAVEAVPCEVSHQANLHEAADLETILKEHGACGVRLTMARKERLQYVLTT